MAPRSHFPAIVAFYRTHRRMPTYREIMRLAGFRSTNAAAKLVKKLVAGRCCIIPKGSRFSAGVYLINRFSLIPACLSSPFGSEPRT